MMPSALAVNVAVADVVEGTLPQDDVSVIAGAFTFSLASDVLLSYWGRGCG